ncbi:MAG: murein transglycosylase [Oscillatoriales cyanobacterium SM2_2_1]|nr:murein transglycosylase [Oscillatoriales cyanobacterium SM2_2_1]
MSLPPDVAIAHPQWVSLQTMPALMPVPSSAFLAGLTDDRFEGDRSALLGAVDHSLRFIRTPSAARRYPVAGITRERMERSLVRFRRLVEVSRTAADLQRAVAREFVAYQSIGLDGKGTVQFTGYYEAVYPGSRVRTAEYRFPLYRLPPNFAQWRSPHPPRAMLEQSNLLSGLELVWLRDQLQAFLIHIQGSARLQLTDGTVMTVGFGGKTDRTYTSIGRELVKDGKMRLEEVTLPALIAYFERRPQELSTYLMRNESFIFFRETNGSPATGSIGVPVTAERSIATDKSLMPPGGLALIRTQLPMGQEFRSISRFVLDQDTGSAIRGAGRVDVFMGTGNEAKRRSGVMNHDGELYYLVLRQ